MYHVAYFRHSARKGAVLLPWALATCSGFLAATQLNFRHLLEKHNLSAAVFAKVDELLLANGLKLCGGTIVDATSQLPHLVPPITKTKRETLKCTKPFRASNGTLAWRRTLVWTAPQA